MKRTAGVLVGVLMGVGVLSAPASAVIDSTPTSSELAQAMTSQAGLVTGSALLNTPPGDGSGASTVGVSTTTLTGFPPEGTNYSMLSTGDVALATAPNSEEDNGVDMLGDPVRGETDYDVTVLRVDLNVPAGANCLSFDFRFLSEEYPEFVGTEFNDAFIAELDSSTWSTAGSEIIAPNNFAVDPEGQEISVNATGETSVSEAAAAGTTYDAATPRLTAISPVTPGAHSLYLSIFDQGDHIYDSIVFMDALQTSTEAAGICVVGSYAYQPDLRVKSGVATSAVGDNIYNVTGTNQTKLVKSPAGEPTIYNVTVQNDGGKADTISILGCASSTGFKVAYSVGGTSMTSQIVAGTYQTTLPPAGQSMVKLKIVPKSTATGIKVCEITGTSLAEPGSKDMIRAKLKIR